MNKNTLLAINGVLVVAVIFLFFKVFTMKPGEVQVVDGGNNGADAAELMEDVLNAFEGDTSEATLASVAFVLSDSLVANYLLVAEIEGKLDQKQRSIQYTQVAKEEELNAEMQRLQEDAYALTEAEYMERQAALEQLYYEGQETMYRMEEEYAQLTNDLYADLYDRITEFLDRYAAIHGYDYVLQVSSTTGVLYANERLDITGPVVAALNSEYEAAQANSQ